jgi:hypothetical protein
MIIGVFAQSVPAPPAPHPQTSPLAQVLAKHKGGKGNSVHRKYNKPNKWDILNSSGNRALCRNRTTGEVAMKNVKLSFMAQYKWEQQLEALNV